MNYKYKLIYYFLFAPYALISALPTSYIVLHTLPKSGTHLLGKAVELLTGRTPCYNVKSINWSKNYYLAHELRLLPKNLAIKLLTIIRDPRDRLVSLINALEAAGSRKYKDKNLELIVAEILQDLGRGFSFNYGVENYRLIRTLDQLYQREMPLLNFNKACIVHFERLVGPQGGGCLEEQEIELSKIAQHLGVKLDQVLLGYAVNNLFGGTATFHQGKIGSWKTFFSEQNKELLKESLGDWLIKLGYEKDHNW